MNGVPPAGQLTYPREQYPRMSPVWAKILAATIPTPRIVASWVRDAVTAAASESVALSMRRSSRRSSPTRSTATCRRVRP